MVQLSYTEFVNTDLGRWLDERLKANQADVVHDLLAYLAEQMIAMNKEKQGEVKGFLTWLEREIGAKVEDLTNKTKLQSYHGHDLETLIAALYGVDLPSHEPHPPHVRAPCHDISE